MINIYDIIKNCSLSNTNTKIKTTVQNILKKEKIDEKLFEYNKRPQMGHFSLLPKIYKKLFNVPGRPINSKKSTATKNILTYLDYHLKSLVPSIPHILRGNPDLLYWINQIKNLPADAILVSLDVVVELNPNILYDEGIKTMKEWLEDHTDRSVSTESLRVILKINYFVMTWNTIRKDAQLFGPNLLPYICQFVYKSEFLITTCLQIFSGFVILTIYFAYRHKVSKSWMSSLIILMTFIR